ncbi:ATP-binding cassette domain-containing protein [Methanofollis aquaemaris]|uniref:ATP-binding cassette domain-containing protein n=1 Tax=Methanofollis aquaemaris TaxID=126734 RepID=A0A8A3S5D3_9EURY|nr:ATP-binding cassette domain-containing protein [Methanofollis aquaemaris]QSZ67348.1 ATP-binding cassette domain-containing protein [Methanofollis aquaemaris]
MDLQVTEITVLPGRDKNGETEHFDRIVIRPGETLAIVGPTGSGKSAFINDIEVFARDDTVTGRTVLVNGAIPPDDYVRDPAKKPIALITQNTKCLADLKVAAFLEMHVRSRKIEGDEIISETIALANEFTGEKITPGARMTSLSGGQTRSLMVADAILVGSTPVIILDEVENAGIFKDRVIEVLRRYQKAVVFVTHDPLVALMCDRRVVMRNGTVVRVIEHTDSEDEALSAVKKMDGILCRLRERIRAGEAITGGVQAV